jgi:hypothetical protein
MSASRSRCNWLSIAREGMIWAAPSFEVEYGQLAAAAAR